ncbi:uncharacterized protein LY89DRAFT_672835 [Mollisia scopiformis]|uniref:Anaphase-promoting complex subunit 4 n=1 Tax=Mollisia scopiformis TaxID=149040 RepID=A0A194WYD6_MOLSC|nr:uncharacterized protein LY89DRAFT_672835 [Mollisia scopiformis]KUJ12694.1 hypothetical protein LY89DRAFT_672835 [Mollisia scopiformis]
MGAPSHFQLLSEKTLHHTADPALVAYCPSMDLVALVTIDQQVLIYRLNGQRVYGATQKTGAYRVTSIRWKPNGQLLAIAWSDGSIRLVGAESSKIVHWFSTGIRQASDITCIGWSTNLTNRSTSSVTQKKGEDSWNTILATGELDAILDLPRDLSLIDIETSLPKLSVLAAGGSDEVFSSRSSLDALFRAFDPKDNNAVDVMVVGTLPGTIHLSIYDSFEIGSFPSPRLPGDTASQLVLHASHKQYSTHSLLLRASAPGPRLYFVPMDLRFISASSEYLSLLASRATALQNLLRYIDQVQLQMSIEWKSTQELPGRFLSNINETLMEKDNRDIVQALYHSVATGHTFPSVREWLVDELSERGHKRWDKAVTTGLENLRRLVHENMLPALERCSLILSRFSGIAKFQGSNSSLGFTTQQINTIMDRVACLHLVSSKILIQVVDELELFTSFSSWLRNEIDRVASDASASPADDAAAEKEASIDHNKVLSYIQNAMTSSPLAIYMEKPPEDFLEDWTHGEDGMPMYDLLDKQLQKQERGLPYIKLLPRVEVLYKLLMRQTGMIFGQIADAEMRNVLFGKPYEVGPAHDDSPMHMRMIAENKSTCETYIAYVPGGSQGILQVVRVIMSLENGISSPHSVSSTSLQLGNGIIKDLKIWDDSEILALWESNTTTSLLNIPYKSNLKGNLSNYALNYSPHSSKGKGGPTPHFSNQEVLQQFCKYKLSTDQAFVPERLEIRASSDMRHNEGGEKQADSRRIILLSKDRLHYRVLRLGKADALSEVAEDEDISMS